MPRDARRKTDRALRFNRGCDKLTLASIESNCWCSDFGLEAIVLQDFAFVGIFVIVGSGLVILPMLLNWLLAPKKPNKIKSETYECGIETVGETWVQFKAQYYIYALIFAIFDIETVFLFPWAVAYKEFRSIFPLVEMILFVLILVGGLIYAWRKGVLEWA
jgi:NADH:ubiquinone oxidoreductase subunit 3 (subunit A)